MTENTCLLFRGGLATRFKATDLEMALALLMDASIRLFLYFLSMRNSLSSANLSSLLSCSVQVLVIRSARLYGIFFMQSGGWILLVKRYWFLSVGFLYRSTDIFPFMTVRLVSRNGIDFSGVQSHLSSGAS